MSKKRKFMRLTVVMFMITALLFTNSSIVNASSTSSVKQVRSQKEFVRSIYKNLLAKEKTFTMKYKGDWNDLGVNNLDSLLKKVFAIDDKSTSDDFDYLRENIQQYSLKITSDGRTSKLTFKVSYRETKAQTKKVNKRVQSVLKSLDLEDRSDYAKIKIIHDYIVNRVSYDQSYSKYTAYNAMVNKSAVCQGYALLFYKMATEADVPCRIVTSSTHAWNIVKLDGKWYHIDVTWDDPVSDRPILRYDYFLKGSDSMTEAHKLKAEYKTKTFKKAYPISETDYRTE